jgi:hypothetical protein
MLTYISYTNGFTHITRKEPKHGQLNRVLSKNGHEPSKVHFQTKTFNIIYLHASQLSKEAKTSLNSYTICAQ